MDGVPGGIQEGDSHKAKRGEFSFRPCTVGFFFALTPPLILTCLAFRKVGKHSPEMEHVWSREEKTGGLNLLTTDEIWWS
jgi:hypothetical protein